LLFNIIAWNQFTENGEMRENIVEVYERGCFKGDRHQMVHNPAQITKYFELRAAASASKPLRVPPPVGVYMGYGSITQIPNDLLGNNSMRLSFMEPTDRQRKLGRIIYEYRIL